MSFWLKVMRETPDKPEIHLIAAELGLDPDTVFGKVFRIWAWFDEHTLDGTAPVTLASRLGDVGRHERIIDAMIKVGWIKRDDSFLSLVSFEKHNGETARKRALSAERSRKYRITLSSRSNHENVTPKKKNKYKPPLPPKQRQDDTRNGAPPASKPGAPALSPVEAKTPTQPRTPGQRLAGLTHLSAVLTKVLPTEPVPDDIRAELESKPPIPIPTDEEQPPLAAASP